MIAPFLNQSLPLDIIKDAPPAAAYGLRRLKSGYKGAPIRVRRSSDDAELDIPFCGQYLCIGTLMAFVTTNSAYVVTVYDQSGNANHATQTTAANQPRIVNAGVLDVKNAIASMVYNGANSFIEKSGFAISNIFSVCCVASSSGGDGRRLVTISDNTNSVNTCRIAYTASTTLVRFGNRFINSADEDITADTTFNLSNLSQITGIRSSINSEKIYINGANSVTQANTTTTFTSQKLNIGGTSLTYWQGNISEIIIFPFALTDAQRQKIERNQGKYYGIGVA